MSVLENDIFRDEIVKFLGRGLFGLRRGIVRGRIDRNGLFKERISRGEKAFMLLADSLRDLLF